MWRSGSCLPGKGLTQKRLGWWPEGNSSASGVNIFFFPTFGAFPWEYLASPSERWDPERKHPGWCWLSLSQVKEALHRAQAPGGSWQHIRCLCVGRCSWDIWLLCGKKGELAQVAMPKWVRKLWWPYSRKIQPFCTTHNCLRWNLSLGQSDVKVYTISLGCCFLGAGPWNTGRLWKGRGMGKRRLGGGWCRRTRKSLRPRRHWVH